MTKSRRKGKSTHLPMYHKPRGSGRGTISFLQGQESSTKTPIQNQHCMTSVIFRSNETILSIRVKASTLRRSTLPYLWSLSARYHPADSPRARGQDQPVLSQRKARSEAIGWARTRHRGG